MMTILPHGRRPRSWRAGIHLVSTTIALVLGLTACIDGPAVAPDQVAAMGVIHALPASWPVIAPRDPNRSRSSYVANGRQAMVATAHPLATAAALEVLRAGGNAFDAFAAASFAISVVRPQSTGIGGGGFMVAYQASDKRIIVKDFRERAPAAATANMYLDRRGEVVPFVYAGRSFPDAALNGHQAVATPGLVRGVLAIHERFGRLPRAAVLKPARELADKGILVYPALAAAIGERRELLCWLPASALVFCPSGQPLATGMVLRQADLAWTLDQLSEHGAEAFYRGQVAQRLLAEMRRGGGIMTAGDLAGYQVIDRQPVIGTYHGYKLASMPPPSSGGVHILEILNILTAGTDLSTAEYGAESLHALAAAMQRAYADRAQYLGDPDYVKVPVAALLSPAYAQRQRDSIAAQHATPSSQVRAGAIPGYESPSTTHLAVVDRWGNAVSSTQTINFTFGSGVVAAGTGIVLNDEMDDFAKKPGVPNAFGLVGSRANAVAPGKTPLSSMSPTLAFRADGSLALVVGSPGGGRIITATLQTIINHLGRHLSLADAVHAARIHHQWLPDELLTEPDGMRPETAAALRAMGYTLNTKGYIGDVQAVAVAPDSGLTGVSDTRSDGQPGGF